MNNTEFWNKVSKGYVKSKISDIESYQTKLEKTQEYFTKDMDVLEVGSGTGMTAVIHAPHVKHYHATDLSEGMLAFAQERIDEADLKNITLEAGAVESLSVEDGSKDVVLAMSLLHLLDDPEAGIQHIHKYLKKDGLFISSTICLGDKMNYFKPLFKLMKLVKYAPSVVHFFKKKELVSMIENAGFKIEHDWQPGPKKAAFIVARKRETL